MKLEIAKPENRQTTMSQICTITIRETGPDTADVKIDFDPPIPNNSEHVPNSVEILATQFMRAIQESCNTQRLA